LVEANPNVNPDQIEAGTQLVIPTVFVLPPAPKKGMVINLAELRMYYYPPDGKTVVTYPLGIGRDAGWSTPLGVTRITEKTKNPTWVPPKSIRDFRKKEGVDLPAAVPPGLENPLGAYRMRLAIPNGAYLIHGTNDATGVGRRSSSGCIRMAPEDVEELYEKVPSGTPVNIINEPYKVGWLSGKVFLEAHVPLEEQSYKYARTLTPLVKVLKGAKGARNTEINWELADSIARTPKGIPEQIGVLEGKAELISPIIQE
jgi:L,D-transpeptidase ErfK/SrfK